MIDERARRKISSLEEEVLALAAAIRRIQAHLREMD